jgi:hypothetical protein
MIHVLLNVHLGIPVDAIDAIDAIDTIDAL